MKALFGPAGNSASFAAAGYKHTYEAPKWLNGFEIHAYEYSAGNGIVGSDATFSRIGEEARKYDVKLSLHAPYFISLSSVEPEKRIKSIDYIAKSVHAAECMGAYLIVIHTGSAAKLSRAEALDYARDTMFKALEALPDTSVRFGLETMGKLNQLGTLEEVIELCSMDERLYPVVDFGHINAREQGGAFHECDDYRRVFDRIAQVLGAEKARELHCHFSKIEYTAAGEKRHLRFDDDRDNSYGPPFEPLIEAIVKDDLAPRIICESNGTMLEDALEMQNYYLNALQN